MRILVCEDEPEVASFLFDALSEVGYAVEVARDGLVALNSLASGSFDAAVLDVMLPGMEGVEVVRRLRARKIRTPVLLLTARFRVEDRIEGLDAGADDYLVKPFALGELLARVRALLRRPPSELPVLHAAGVELDPATRRVTFRGRPAYLSATEFSLLHYLMRNQGRVLTKMQILDHVWDDQGYRSPNTVEVYVNYLRTKLDSRVIRTVRGVGYVLAAPDED